MDGGLRLPGSKKKQLGVQECKFMQNSLHTVLPPGAVEKGILQYGERLLLKANPSSRGSLPVFG